MRRFSFGAFREHNIRARQRDSCFICRHGGSGIGVAGAVVLAVGAFCVQDLSNFPGLRTGIDKL